jgi:hypothetical protein
MSLRSRTSSLALTLALLVPATAHAYFEETAAGARAVAIGPSSVAIVTDASAYYWNAAALGQMGHGEALIDYAKPYGVPDLSVGALVLAVPRFGTGWAAGWHRLAIAGVYSEDQFVLAAGRRLTRVGAHQVFGGLTYKLGRVALQDFTDPGSGGTVSFGSQARGSLDAGLKWVTPWNIDLAWTGRDLIEPRYELVYGSGGDLQKARHELAAAFRWNRESTLAFGWSQPDLGPASFSAGLEITFYDVFAIRSGLTNVSRIYEAYGSPNDLQYTGGIGIYHRGFQIDAAALTNHELGASYRMTLRVPFHAEAR